MVAPFADSIPDACRSGPLRIRIGHAGIGHAGIGDGCIRMQMDPAM